MMIDQSHAEFGFAIDLFLDKYADPLTREFKGKKYRDTLAFTCFAELVGSKSMFGQHDYLNDTFDITLIDVDRYKKGLIEPMEFIDNFSVAGIPKVVYAGNLNKELVQRVKSNEFGLKEGVICKGKIPHKKENNLFYCKIKTDEWFDRLRNRDPQLYAQELKQLNS